MEQQTIEVLAKQNNIPVTANIFTSRRDELRTSDRYLKFDDSSILEVLNANGWYITKYAEVKAQKLDRQQFKPYLAHYTNASIGKIHDGQASIVQRGAHDGTKTLDLLSGFFRAVCENGLIAGEHLIEPVRLKHIGDRTKVNELNDIVIHLIQCFPRVVNSIKSMDTRILTLDEQMGFARLAAEIRFGDRAKGIDARSLLQVRRSGDAGDSLWKVFNRVQEAIVNAPTLQIVNENNKQRKVRALTSIEQQVSVNRDLWTAAETFLQ